MYYANDVEQIETKFTKFNYLKKKKKYLIQYLVILSRSLLVFFVNYFKVYKNYD